MKKLNIMEHDMLVKLLLYFGVTILLLPINNVWAAAGSDASQITNVLCNVYNMISGNVGKAITALIMVSLGIMLLLGKVTWGVAIALAVGIGVIFGAKDMVGLMSGNSDVICGP